MHISATFHGNTSTDWKGISLKTTNIGQVRVIASPKSEGSSRDHEFNKVIHPTAVEIFQPEVLD